MERRPLGLWTAFALALLVGGGCLGEAERSNPFDPLSDGFERVGDVTGLILDRGFQGIPEAEVRLLPQGTASQAEYVNRTDGQGQFFFRRIPIGVYRVAVEKEGYIGGGDTLGVELAQRVEKVVMMEGLPAITEARFASVHISRRSSTAEELYFLEVQATVVDPDRASDIERVWLEIPELEGAYELRETAALNRYEVLLSAEQLPVGTLHELLGRALVLNVRDRSGFTGETPPHALARVIDETPLTEAPQEGAFLSDRTPRLEWESVQLPYPFTYRVEVTRTESDMNFTEIVWTRSGISSRSTTVTVDTSLSSGSYYWTVWVVDAFGNRSRSKESAFNIG